MECPQQPALDVLQNRAPAMEKKYGGSSKREKWYSNSTFSHISKRTENSLKEIAVPMFIAAWLTTAGKGTSVDRQTTGQTQCGMHVQWNVVQPEA